MCRKQSNFLYPVLYIICKCGGRFWVPGYTCALLAAGLRVAMAGERGSGQGADAVGGAVSISSSPPPAPFSTSPPACFSNANGGFGRGLQRATTATRHARQQRTPYVHTTDMPTRQRNHQLCTLSGPTRKLAVHVVKK